MLVSKFNFVFVLCLLQGCMSKPTVDLTQSRGIGSTVWGWVSYPFTWWSSESDVPTTKVPTIVSPYSNDNIEIGRRNVTVWCNDQTCTTMRCDKFGCYNLTCNIYDTDLMGECRVYNTVTAKPIEVTTLVMTNTVPETTTKISEETFTPATTATSASIIEVKQEERPLELEAVLSSTVVQTNEKSVPVILPIKDSSSPQNKV